MLKKYFFTVIALFMALSISMSALPVSASADVTVKLDNVVLNFDVAPRLVGGRTMVPLRVIFEALGATVEWDNETQTVTAYNEVAVVKCSIGNNVMYVNEVAKTIDVAPMIIDSRTLVPARFIAESFNCQVDWDGNTRTVSIVSTPIDYTQLEKETESTNKTEEVVTPQVPVVSNNGSREYPYSASDGAVVTYQEWSHKPARKVAVTCINVIRGTQANSLAHSENMFNDKPDSNSEWIFMEFNVEYVSSEGGSDDVLEGNDVIYDDTFFTTSGAAVSVKDMATLGEKYRGYGVFDVEIYPGGSAKVVIGLLIEKNIGDLVLRIPNKGANTNTWINCTNGFGSSSGATNTTVTTTSSESSNTVYYSGTSVPNYTSITGEPLKEYSSATNIYIYDDNGNDYVDYITALTTQYGWTNYNNKTKDGRLTYYLTKNGVMVGVTYAAKYSEVWIVLPQ